MLNKSSAKLDYLHSGDVLEALWLDMDLQSAKVKNDDFIISIFELEVEDRTFRLNFIQIGHF